MQLSGSQKWDNTTGSGTFETFIEGDGKGAASTGADTWIPQAKLNPACQTYECQRLLVYDPGAHCLPAFLLYASQFIAAIAVRFCHFFHHFVTFPITFPIILSLFPSFFLRRSFSLVSLRSSSRGPWRGSTNTIVIWRG